MVFTRHAVARYMQFHMMDRPTATEKEAREILEQHAETAIRAPHKSFRGDPVWNIEALGIEVIAKHEDGVDVAVTVLPPPMFRGLTPLQAERVAARVAVAESAIRAAEQAIEQAKVQPDAEAIAPNQVRRTPEAHRLEQERIALIRDLKERRLVAENEHSVLMSTLKTMRTQMTAEGNLKHLKQALRVALRYLRTSTAAGSTETLARIGEIEAGLLLDAFIDGGAP